MEVSWSRHAVHVVDRVEENADPHPVTSRSATKNTVEEVWWWLACVKTPNSQCSRSSSIRVVDRGRQGADGAKPKQPGMARG